MRNSDPAPLLAAIRYESAGLDPCIGHTRHREELMMPDDCRSVAVDARHRPGLLLVPLPAAR